MKYDGIIFDIDGTLWNAAHSSAKGWNIGLEQLGAKERVSSEDIERVTGNPMHTCVQILLPDLNKKYPDLAHILNIAELEVIQKEGGKLYEGVRNGIPQLSKKFSLYLVSNCDEGYLELFLKFSGLRDYFKDVDCYGCTQTSKGQTIKGLVERNSLKNPVYIGDTKGDQEATLEAGVDFIFASYGFGDVKNPSVSINSFRELIPLIEEDKEITFSIIKTSQEIEILRGKTSQYEALNIQYDEETIALLKKNLEREDSLYLLAMKGNEFVAFCSIDSDWWEDGYFFLREIFIEPKFQKQRLGEQLIKNCIDHARGHNARGVVTETAFENIPMQKICERLGFKKWDNPQWKEGITYKFNF